MMASPQTRLRLKRSDCDTTVANMNAAAMTPMAR